MSAQDLVTVCYPDAEARRARASFERGTDYPFHVADWAIFGGTDSDAEELGRGRTEAEAWSDAAGLLGNQAA